MRYVISLVVVAAWIAVLPYAVMATIDLHEGGELRASIEMFVDPLHPCEAPIDTGLLWLVNRDNPLPSDYRPCDLVTYKGAELREPARDAYVQMLAAMEAEGVKGLQLQSAYRTYSYQRAIFEQKVKTLITKGSTEEEARVIAAQSIQLAGSSEHQLGLALDVSINGQLSQAFAETEAGQWLANNCFKYGFVIRYPQSKTDVTNIIYEPWHLRYVGIPHAQIMTEAALTLEEYHLYLSQIEMHIVWEEDFYYLVIYSDYPLSHMGDSDVHLELSTTEFGEHASYIITVAKYNYTR